MPNRSSLQSDLDDYVRTAKAADVPDPSLVALLQNSGWPARRVYQSLGAYYHDRLGRPLPERPVAGENARDAFYFLLSFALLGTWTIALGSIFYDVIARAFPDTANASYAGSSLLHDIAWQLAALLVAFPIFAWLDRIIAGELKKRPEFSSSGVRSWLTYLALVVAGLTVIGDFIAFLATFLDGGLSVRFALDSLVLLVLAGGVFVYYLRGMGANPAVER